MEHTVFLELIHEVKRSDIAWYKDCRFPWGIFTLHNNCTAKEFSSQVFTIRFSLDLNFWNILALLTRIEGGAGLCGSLYLSGARLCYFGLLFWYQ